MPQGAQNVTENEQRNSGGRMMSEHSVETKSGYVCNTKVNVLLQLNLAKVS
jgi:hypothetical protein